MSKNVERALILAREARSYERDGRVVEADEADRTIDDLVGYWAADGVWSWPRPVREARYGACSRPRGHTTAR